METHKENKISSFAGNIFTAESNFQRLGANKYNSQQNCLCKGYLEQIFSSHLSN